jgi:hypothetical protein
LATVLAVSLGIIWLPGEAWATCTPAAPVNNADVTCTGTTTEQNAPNGYGTNTDTGNAITVAPGASVTGTGSGIVFDTGTVTNSGTISGGNFGIFANTTATITNFGTITGAGLEAIGAITANVTNFGTVTGAFNGIGATTANVTNFGTITGVGFHGISAVGTANVTNSGTIMGANSGIGADTANVKNSGAISGGNFGIGANTTATVVNSGTITGTGIDGIFSANAASVTNSGTITGAFNGIDAITTAIVTNSGTISGGSGSGVTANGNVTVTNSGTISGGTYGIFSNAAATVTNSGTISGGTVALVFFGGAANTLTLLPGSTIIGEIQLNGGGDTVNFRGGNHNLTFDTLAGATVTGTTPFVVSGNRVVAIDPTPFAMAGRTLLDFSRAVSSAVPDIEGSFTTSTAAADSSSALAFAGPDALPAAKIPGLSAYADDSTLPFKSPTVVYGNGTALWARGFAGEREQDADGAMLKTRNRFYGGLLGGGWQVRPDLRLGLFAGAGETRSTVYPGYGEIESRLVFAGLTGRYSWGASFLRFGVQGGHSSNDSTRNINNNLVAGGIENAAARFNGWYVTPEATFGHHVALGSVGGGAYTLTPSLNVRYLHASLNGYTETGTTAPLTVGGRTVDSFEERAQLKLTRTQVFAPGEALKTSLFGGALADQRVGGNTIDAVLLGQAIPFATPGNDSVWGGFGGASLEWRTGRVTLFASAEYLTLSDSSSVLSGQGGVRVAF